MVIRIYRNQLKFEIDIETRKAGFFQVDNEKPELVNEAQLGTEFTSKAYFERKSQQGVDALLDVLHKFVVSCDEEDVMYDEGENVLEDKKTWVITLSFDDMRRNIITKSLASLCHKYIAYNMLYSWAVMTMPNLANEYKEQRQATYNDIQRIVYRKEAPVLEEDGEDEDEDSGKTYAEMVSEMYNTTVPALVNVATTKLTAVNFVNPESDAHGNISTYYTDETELASAMQNLTDAITLAESGAIVIPVFNNVCYVPATFVASTDSDNIKHLTITFYDTTNTYSLIVSSDGYYSLILA